VSDSGVSTDAAIQRLVYLVLTVEPSRTRHWLVVLVKEVADTHALDIAVNHVSQLHADLSHKLALLLQPKPTLHLPILLFDAIDFDRHLQKCNVEPNTQHKTTTTTTTTTTNNNNQQPTTNNQQPTTNTNNGYKVGEAMPSHERATKVAMLPRHTYPTNVSLTATFLSHTTTSINNIDFTIGLDGNDRHQATQCDRCPARAAEDGSSR
jgi:hypothetical protein